MPLGSIFTGSQIRTHNFWAGGYAVLLALLHQKGREFFNPLTLQISYGAYLTYSQLISHK